MDIRDIFAANVRRHRKAHGLSQEKLAEIAGLHRTYIGGIEQRRINVSLKNIGKIADALEVDPAALFTDNPDIESAFTWKLAAQDVGDALAERRQDDPLLAVVTWVGEDIVVEPIEAAYEDLTIQVLANLIEKGYTGEELAKRYQRVSDEISKFTNGRLGSRP